MPVALHLLGMLMGFCSLTAYACLRVGADSERAMEDPLGSARGKGGKRRREPPCRRLPPRSGGKGKGGLAFQEASGAPVIPGGIFPPPP